MDHSDQDASLPVFEEPLPSAEGALPHLLDSLILRTPSVVPDVYLSVDHEEVVQAHQELSPIPATDGDIEHQALSVEIPADVEEIEDLPPNLWFPTEDLAIVQNGHGFSNHNFLDVVTASASDELAESSNALTNSADSIYEDALSGEVEPVPQHYGMPNLVDQFDPETEPDVHEAGQLALGAGYPGSYESGVGSPFVDPTGNVSAPVADAVYPEDNGLAPVGQPVYVAVQDAVLDAPLAEPEDAEENVPFDPLEASPLLATLGFQRVQQAYERWLVNMSHAVSLYQGKLSQIYFSP